MSAVRDRGDAFVLEADGATALASYACDGDRYLFSHTEVPAALSGQGIGTRLIAGALDTVRGRGGRVIAACSFVAHFIETHPDYADLLA